MNKDTIKQRLVDHSTANHRDGYVSDIRDNLISTISLDDFYNDLNNGDGNELDKKFKAIYSSSALVVNFFGFFKRHLDKFSIFGESDFKSAQFEKKLPTGLKGKPPNLDFYIESDGCIIGFESKFLEPLTPKQPIFQASYSNGFLSSIDNGLPILVNHYRTNNSQAHLDTAQLIKHSIGLLKNKGNKKAKLVYIYWAPLNAENFPIYKQHRLELENFNKQITTVPVISFHHISYLTFYNNYVSDNIFKQHLSYFKEKYFLKII